MPAAQPLGEGGIGIQSSRATSRWGPLQPHETSSKRGMIARAPNSYVNMGEDPAICVGFWDSRLQPSHSHSTCLTPEPSPQHLLSDPVFRSSTTLVFLSCVSEESKFIPHADIQLSWPCSSKRLPLPTVQTCTIVKHQLATKIKIYLSVAAACNSSLWRQGRRIPIASWLARAAILVSRIGGFDWGTLTQWII